MARLLIVSNRLPITVTRGEDGFSVERSPGGLATGLSGHHSRSDALWLGWPGDVQDLSEEERAWLVRRLEELRSVPVWLDPDDVAGFYEGFSNEVLWPLFHYLLGQIPQVVRGWDSYERANRRFADLVVEHYQPDDRIWVHDYHLMLVPGMLRERLPDARIGFFLHIPFPASEVFRTVPYRERLLAGLLGADLVGFHTAPYMRAFASSLLRVLGVEAEVDRVHFGGREIRLGTFPMGIDVQKFVALAGTAEVERLVERYRDDGSTRILLGVDRLDYTKGIRRRLLAFERLLLDHPELRERIRLVQVAVPSRTNVGAYQEFRNEVDALIGRINGALGTPRWSPIHYLYRGFDEAELVALYRSADVMLVTPVRDGMNLVAKEFVASRTDEDGVLVLSEFAGAASELAEALMVNPYDVERTAETFRRALLLAASERRARMRALRRRVIAFDVRRWVSAYLDELEEACGARGREALAMTRPEEIERLVERMRAAPRLLLLLGYDGTLVPLASVPELSRPDEDLLELLRRLAERPGTEIHLVSGSSRELVEDRFGELPIHLHAEYGFWSRPAGSSSWTHARMPPLDWRDHVLGVLQTFAARTPGSLVEEKTVSLAWHYRMAEPDFGSFQANELRSHLTQLLSNEPVEIVTDERVVTVRPFGVNKSMVVGPLLREAPPGTQVVAMGDDRTDEDLFAALPEGAIAIHVGSGPSRADVRVRNFDAARKMLASLLGEGAGARDGQGAKAAAASASSPRGDDAT